jgi:hypothetical protein
MPSDWTVDNLREYLERRIDDEHALTLQQFVALHALLEERYGTQTKALDAAFVAAEKAVQTALASAEKAVVKAETAAERRFESVNEFRQTLTDQATTFMPRTEAEQRIATNAEKIDALAARVDKTEGRSGGLGTSWSLLVSAVSLIAVIITIYLATKGG